MNKKASKKVSKKFLIITFSILSLIIGPVLIISFVFYIAQKPYKDAIAEAKLEAAYLLEITNETNFQKVGEVGRSETIGTDNRCFTYVFQGSGDFTTAKNITNALINKAGYVLEKTVYTETSDKYSTETKDPNGWTTRLQVLNNAGFLQIYEDTEVIDNPVIAEAQDGQILVSSQVCNH